MAAPGREPDIEFTFDPDPSAPREARQAIERLVSGPDDPISDGVRLVTSELVTNVVLHTEQGGALRAWQAQPPVPVRLEVEDQDPASAAVPTAAPGVGGRGLLIVDQLADDWGVEPTPTGKVVWAEFLRRSSLDLPRPTTPDGDVRLPDRST